MHDLARCVSLRKSSEGMAHNRVDHARHNICLDPIDPCKVNMCTMKTLQQLDPIDPCKVNMCTMKTLQQLHPTDISIYSPVFSTFCMYLKDTGLHAAIFPYAITHCFWTT